MGKLSYTRVGWRCSRTARVFRLCTSRYYGALRLRSRLLRLIGILTRCFDSHKISGAGRPQKSISRRSLVSQKQQHVVLRCEYGLTFCGRSNSFDAEAVAACLEFIKRTSVSTSDADDINRHEETETVDHADSLLSQ